MSRIVNTILDFKQVVLFIIILWPVLFATTVVEAAFYTWTDKEGTYHVSDDLSKVPPEFRPNSVTPGPATSDEQPEKGRDFEKLIGALQSSETAEGAARALAQMEDERTVDPLIELLYRKGFKWYHGRNGAIQALAKIGSPRAIKGLISVLDDTDVAYYATTALVAVKDRVVTDVLASTICDEQENPRIIFESGKVLSEMGKKRGAEPLLECLRNSKCSCTKINNCSGREAAVYFLGQMKYDRAVAPLVEMLNEQIVDKYVTNSMHDLAARALKEITGQNLGTDYQSWMKWMAENKLTSGSSGTL